MSEQFQYVTLDPSDNFQVRLRPNRIPSVTPPLKETLSVASHEARISLFHSPEELDKFTAEYLQYIKDGDMAILYSEDTVASTMLTWVNKNLQWQPIVLSEPEFSIDGGVL